MLTFEASTSRGITGGSWKLEGYRAAGPVVMVIEHGSIWVADQHGVRQRLGAPGVVMWDTGDWVQYGSDGPTELKEYWAPRQSAIGFHPCGPVDAPRGTPGQEQGP
jgi:hypothetical protein